MLLGNWVPHKQWITGRDACATGRKISEGNPVPADFRLPSGINICTEGGGEELAAKADAEDRLAVLESVFNQTDLVTELGKLLLFIHAVRAAHDNQARGITDFLGNALVLEGMDVF